MRSNSISYVLINVFFLIAIFFDNGSAVKLSKPKRGQHDTAHEWIQARPPRGPLRDTKRMVSCDTAEMKKTAYTIIGTYHKTGTKLMRELAKYYNALAGGGNMTQLPCSYGWGDTPTKYNRTLFSCELKKSQVDSLDAAVHGDYGGTWRGVQLLRHPVEMMLSAYLYHTRPNQLDCGQLDPSHTPGTECDCEKMRQSSIADGLMLQAQCTSNMVKVMLEVFNAYHSNPNMLVLYFENFLRNASSWDEQAQLMYDHISRGCGHGLDNLNFMYVASLFDRSRHPENGLVDHNSTSAVMAAMSASATKEEKQQVWEAYKKLQHKPAMKELQDFAKKLGYE